LLRLQDALSAISESEGKQDAPHDIAPDLVAPPMRERLPEITWRVLALLGQIPRRGAILLTPLRPSVVKEGACHLCGEMLADPHHFPPRCELCGLATQLALGHLSLADLLCT